MSGEVTVVNAPSSPLFDETVAKRHLKIEEPDDDTILPEMISAATAGAEHFTRLTLRRTRFELTLDCFPPQIVLPRAPVIDSTGLAIDYTDTAGASQTLDPAMYKLSPGTPGRIRPAYQQIWPVTRTEMDAVRVTFEAGFDTVPDDIMLAIKRWLRDLYDHRGGFVVGTIASEVPDGIRPTLLRHVFEH